MPAVPPAVPSASPALADNMRRLIALRGITLFVALAMALLAEQVFRIRVDIDALLIVCGVWAMFCAATWWRMTQQGLGPRELLAHLVVDVLLLTVFLLFSGGTANPLTALYLMPVAAAAALLHHAAAWFIAASAIVAYALLWILAVPIVVEDVDAAMQMHLAGMWLTFGLSAGLMVGIVARMGAALRERERQLAAARADSLRNERIAALGSLAAGAAHQLGTPLNTALLLTDEIAAQTAPDSAMATDARELRAQIERCRDIVQSLLSEATTEKEEAAIPVSMWLSRIIDGVRQRRGDCVPALHLDGDIGQRLLRPEATVTQSLADLLDNAAAASPANVVLSCGLRGDVAVFRVCDAGPGFSAQALANIGREPWSDKPGGMGIGLYLAGATAERMGGKLEWRNLDQGAEVLLQIPAAALDLQ